MSKALQDEVTAAAEMLPEIVGYALHLIQEQRFTYVRHEKDGLDGKDDVVTSADLDAQKLYRHYFSLLTPHFGIIGEEDLLVPCRVKGHDVYYTVDPIDGTEAFDRKQSHGIGSMAALVVDGKVVAACIGDVCTGERYAFHPDIDGAVRIDAKGHREPLGPHPTKTLEQHNVLIGQRESRYSPTVQRMVQLPAEGGLFKEVEIDRGSIGIRLARLWKAEVGAYVMRPYYETPWDNTPLIGFNQKLGFLHLKRSHDSGRFEPFEPQLCKRPRKTEHETLMIHASHLPELRAWEDVRRT